MGTQIRQIWKVLRHLATVCVNTYLQSIHWFTLSAVLPL